MSQITPRLLASCAAAGLAALSIPALAQSSADQSAAGDDNGRLPEIVVTADKFSRSIQDTPIALTVVTGDAIAKSGATKIDDVLKNEPAVVVQGAARGFLVSIRGLGLSLPPQMGQGAVGTNFDGAYSSRAENASVGFYDLDRVEVLRGPQGTLYGRNSVGGIVNVVSKNPVLDKVEGYVGLEGGNYSLIHGEGALNVPLGDKVAIRVSGAGISRDGYMSNGHDDNKSYAGRAKLLFKPSDDVSLLLGVEHSALRGQGPGAVPIASILAGTRETTDVSVGFQRVNSYKYWGELRADIGPGTLSILPSLQITKGRTIGAFGGSLADSLDPKLTRQEQIEVRYASQPGSPFDWGVGFYHYKSRNITQAVSTPCQDVDGNYVIPAAGFSALPVGSPPGPVASGTCLSADQARAESYEPEIRRSQTDGIFGQITVPITDTVRAIGGVRYTWEKVSGENVDSLDLTGALTPLNDEHFDYRAGLEADLFGGKSKLYGTIASGYRQGGYSFGLGTFEPETMTSYEIGLKNKLAGGDMLFNLTGFYYDYSAFQLVIANFTVFPPQLFVPTMPGREYGVEAETVIAVGGRGRFNASVTYLDSRLDGLDGFYVGVPFPNSPKWSVKAGYEHAFEFGNLRITPRADLRFSSASNVYPETTVVADTHPSVQNDYATGDVSVQVAFSDSLTFTGYIKNVNDQAIKQSHFFGYAQLAAPRTYGLTANYKF
ncbi:TonB-dependent receptor [Novosphingobium sp. ES2-1]|uniref:TonB-dependent receptor n=1 Tax=Novosphingobium sp. ES2-1 TaxID=2780074 RepID=UPI001880EB40|nr:TonB-dependent receptor [Novosphingobium sp. ES2-1]QOV95584.1 TonB-dependent receptor [Novosphingobium sp. ES2-1]